MFGEGIRDRYDPDAVELNKKRSIAKKCTWVRCVISSERWDIQKVVKKVKIQKIIRIRRRTDHGLPRHNGVPREN